MRELRMAVERMEGRMRKMYEMMVKMVKGRVNVQVCTCTSIISVICVSTAMHLTNLYMNVHCRARLWMMASVW